jgi:hypothetical protein
MLSDAVTEQKLAGKAKDTVEVLDVSQLLARSLAPATPATDAPGPAPAPMS